jgi:hypothetical protein
VLVIASASMKRSGIRRVMKHRLDVAFLCLADGDDLERTARAFDHGEALHLQDGLEHRIRLVDADLRG